MLGVILEDFCPFDCFQGLLERDTFLSHLFERMSGDAKIA
jgi:hypothetical protein